MTKTESRAWSDALRAATRDGLAGLAILPAPGSGLALKRVDGTFATLAEDDLLAGTLRVVDRATGAVSTFPNVDTLLDAGWALD